ncbi:MAG: hypothetical protein EOS58_06235 [Mesorhizobium sp.]|uniref:hypothetical protein n=1 Tax=Mesorhizobium sp. M4A.F.Ca.ET.022.05.2.1 TaxID=2496653 RepID=UPI000FCAB7B1|nr:hypothetical protein [Mesorhizobium sp. M4A.F.Ca.ET.022.05.2.1]RVC78057.1 hypothetical protein EN745_20065 [Mesorhizobium sp. M4A.F.Ca.ET.022.05.2.1]RWD06607.1 MAG: hypothetical protein EOS58_06235 [Mesorhizobium sp.]
MNSLNDSYEVIGRILAKLILNGLRRQRLEPNHVMENVDSDATHHFVDVMEWLRNEGLVTSQAQYTDGSYFGAQLTAKGIAAVERGSFDGSTSIRETVEAKPGGLTSDSYGKIGSLIGGLIGGFAQSAQ